MSKASQAAGARRREAAAPRGFAQERRILSSSSSASVPAATAAAAAPMQAPQSNQLKAITNILTGFSLQVLPRFAFDVRNDLDCNNVEFLSEDVLFYPVGQNFAVYNYKKATFKGVCVRQCIHVAHAIRFRSSVLSCKICCSPPSTPSPQATTAQARCRRRCASSRVLHRRRAEPRSCYSSSRQVSRLLFSAAGVRHRRAVVASRTWCSKCRTFQAAASPTANRR
jgi:hypothetical protein